MLMRIFVFAFYLDHWWCQQPNFSGDFVYTNFESTSYGQLYLDGAAVIPTPCNCCFVEFIDTILFTQEYTVYHLFRWNLPFQTHFQIRG